MTRAIWKRLLALFVMLLGMTTSRTSGAETLVLWHAYSGEEEKALQQILASWQGAELSILPLPHDGYATKLSAGIPMGEGPDVFIDAHERLGDFRKRGLVAPVGDALDPGAFSGPALAAVTLDGVPYAVPLSQKSLAMYINTDLVPTPPGDLEAIAALSLPEGVFPLVYQAPKSYGHAPLLAAFGGTLLAPDGSYGFIGEGAEQSLLFAKRMIDEGVVPGNADGALVKQLFRSGKAAVAFSGPWLAGDLDGVPYSVAPMPIVRATGQPMRPFLTVESAMLSPHGARKPAARALARHLAGKAAARIRMQAARLVSARDDIAVPAGDDFLATFVAQAKTAQPMPTAVTMRSVWEPSDRAIRKVLRNDMAPAEALAEAKWRFDDVNRPLPERASPTPMLFLAGVLLLLAAISLWRRSRDTHFRERLRGSLPAYRYLVHAVIAVGVLVFVPLFAGAAISLYAGNPQELYYVGGANFYEILTVRGGPLLTSGSFYLVLIVTVVWTVVNLAFHLGIGMVLGLLLSRPSLRFRGLYRVLLIIPWAVPSYVTALAWKGMFHRQFGAITGLIAWLNEVFGTSMETIDWFAQFSTAFTANIATNVWLGFPFMMVVTIAALTGVPKEVLEAAEVDGASRWQRFRMVTFPIVRPTMLPAALLGAIWTFNMFNVVFLVSGGEPDGTTDILVSEAYRWAFTRQANYGYAAAYAVLIFLLLMGTTKVPGWLAGRRKRALVEATA